MQSMLYDVGSADPLALVWVPLFLTTAAVLACCHRLGVDSGIIGKKMRLGEKTVEIVGVACPEFIGYQIQKIEFWVSLALSPELVGDIGTSPDYS
jgi:hypothetical protein